MITIDDRYHTKHNIEGREIFTSNFIKAIVSDYTVFEGKIWYIVASYGVGIKYKRTLERPKTGEKVTVDHTVKLFKVIKPTGYINI